jgi:MraZ protein
MFFGEYNHNIDDKGRMSIPSKFREGLGEKFFVTQGLDKCLFVFPYEEWKSFEEKLKNLPLTNRDARAFVRFFYAGAMDCSLDKQGRINLNTKLREHATLGKEVSIIGVGSRVEIWDRNAWEQYNAPDNLSYDDIAEQMAELGI